MPRLRDINRILVIKLRHIGDVLLTVPVFRALRENFPDARITALVNSGTEGVIEGNPSIDEILTFNRGIKRLPYIDRRLKEIDFLNSIRKKDFDMTVDLTGGDRASIISFISGARYRLGWSSKKGFIGKKYLYTSTCKPQKEKHMVIQNLDIVGQLGIETRDFSIDFHIPDVDMAYAGKILRGNDISEKRPIVHIHPTSRWLFKCWKDEYTAEIIKWLLKKKVSVVVTSSPDKKEMDKARNILSLASSLITHHSPRLLDLCGKTTLKQLAAVSSASTLFFGVDSAPMHIAAAVGTPVVALFGPSGPTHWGPWDNRKAKHMARHSESIDPPSAKKGLMTSGSHTVIQRGWGCVPCGRDGCGGSKKSKCLEDITPEEIKDVLTSRLDL